MSNVLPRAPMPDAGNLRCQAARVKGIENCLVRPHLWVVGPRPSARRDGTADERGWTQMAPGGPRDTRRPAGLSSVSPPVTEGLHCLQPRAQFPHPANVMGVPHEYPRDVRQVAAVPRGQKANGPRRE